MRFDWFEHGHKLLSPLVVKGVQFHGKPVTYLETVIAVKVTRMSRDDLENIAMCAVMFGMAGTADALQMKKQ